LRISSLAYCIGGRHAKKPEPGIPVNLSAIRAGPQQTVSPNEARAPSSGRVILSTSTRQWHPISLYTPMEVK
jgi:hypothetical protein